jgi:type IV pilus assembly protein PilM
MARTLVGLEITEESVRAVEITTGRTPKLVASGEVALPPGAAKDSEVLDVDAVAVAIRQLWSRAGIKGRRVVLGIGSRRVLVREYTTQAMRPELLRQALPFQVQDLLPVPAHQAVLDFFPVSEHDGQVTGLLVAAVAETVEKLVATLAKAGLRTDLVDLVPFGLARLAGRLSPGESVAMVHVGDHTTHIVIAVDGVPRFVRVIPIDVPTAATALRAAAERTDAPAALDPVVADLAHRVRSTIAFYGDRPDGTSISGIHLSGAGAALPGLRSALVGGLDITVHEATIGDLVALEQTQVPSESALNLVSTVGVALGEAA